MARVPVQAEIAACRGANPWRATASHPFLSTAAMRMQGALQPHLGLLINTGQLGPHIVLTLTLMGVAVDMDWAVTAKY